MNKESPDISGYKATLEKIAQLLPELNRQKSYADKLDLWLLNGLGFNHFPIPKAEKQEAERFQQKHINNGELPHPISFVEPQTLDELNVFKRYFFSWWFQTESGFKKRKDCEAKYKKWYSEGSEVDIHTITRDEIAELELKKKGVRRGLPANEADFYLLGYDSSMYNNKEEFLDTPSSKSMSITELYRFCQGYNDQQVYQFLRRELVIIEQNIVKENQKQIKKPDVKTPESLFDIWQGTRFDYDEIIRQLKSLYEPIGTAFIAEKDCKLTWLLYPKNGWVQYLKAFVWKCAKEDFILDAQKYSAPQLQRILSNTFNIPDFDPKPFQSFLAYSQQEKYLKAFKFIRKTPN